MTNDKDISQSYLKEMFDYNHETGLFTKKSRPIHHFKNQRGMNSSNSKNAGKIAGRKHHSGYLTLWINGKVHQLHRIAWIYYHGKIDDRQIDHINGIRNDNRISNLRLTNKGENQKNSKKRKDNNSGHTGVSYHKKCEKWQADICVDNKHIYLGIFSSLEEAKAAREKANIKYGFHKNHGRI